MSRKKDDKISQQAEDAIVNKIMQRMSEKGLYSTVMDGLKQDGKAQLVEDSMERHAARQRAAGKKGW